MSSPRALLRRWYGRPLCTINKSGGAATHVSIDGPESDAGAALSLEREDISKKENNSLIKKSKPNVNYKWKVGGLLSSCDKLRENDVCTTSVEIVCFVPCVCLLCTRRGRVKKHYRERSPNLEARTIRISKYWRHFEKRPWQGILKSFTNWTWSWSMNNIQKMNCETFTAKTVYTTIFFMPIRLTQKWKVNHIYLKKSNCTFFQFWWLTTLHLPATRCRVLSYNYSYNATLKKNLESKRYSPLWL